MKKISRPSIFYKSTSSFLDIWVILCVIVFATSLIYSKYTLSMAMIGLAMTMFFPIKDLGSYQDRLVNGLKGNRALWGPIILFLGVVFSGINSDDYQSWIHHLRIKLPLLILPIAVAMLPRIKTDFYYAVIKYFVLLCVLSSLPVLYNYAEHYVEINEAIGQGQPVPVPLGHIRYSLIIAFGGLSAFILYWRSDRSTKSIGMLLVGIYLGVYLHVLAVRSGLAVYYICLIVLAVLFIVKYKYYKLGLMALVLALLLPMIAVKTVPSLERKYGYMMYDIEMYMSGQGRDYSDSERISSIKVGVEIVRNEPILGTGIGDLKQVCKDTYQRLGIASKRALYPHNQFLFVAAGMGVIGLLLFLFGSIWSICQYGLDDLIFVVLHGIIFTSYLVENTIETSIGVGFYVFFLLIALWTQPRQAD